MLFDPELTEERAWLAILESCERYGEDGINCRLEEIAISKSIIARLERLNVEFAGV